MGPPSTPARVPARPTHAAQHSKGSARQGTPPAAHSGGASMRSSGVQARHRTGTSTTARSPSWRQPSSSAATCSTGRRSHWMPRLIPPLRSPCLHPQSPGRHRGTPPRRTIPPIQTSHRRRTHSPWGLPSPSRTAPRGLARAGPGQTEPGPTPLRPWPKAEALAACGAPSPSKTSPTTGAEAGQTLGRPLGCGPLIRSPGGRAVSSSTFEAPEGGQLGAGPDPTPTPTP
mmetsp:Transcript_63329/g.112939  ORF Transcript_63329/g.112939 Transcript_63329/m.112939 type:complete len:229 (+) Transcript_63329:252-938(+)